MAQPAALKGIAAADMDRTPFTKSLTQTTITSLSTTRTSSSTALSSSAAVSSTVSNRSTTSVSKSTTPQTSSSSTPAGIAGTSSLRSASNSASKSQGQSQSIVTSAAFAESSGSTINTYTSLPSSISRSRTHLSTYLSSLPTESPVAVTKDSCTGVICSPALAAAIFVPVSIVVVVLPLCIIALICCRRRRRGKDSRSPSDDAEMSYTASFMPWRRGNWGPAPPYQRTEPSTAVPPNPSSINHSNNVNGEFGLGFVAESPSISSCATAHSRAPPPYGCVLHPSPAAGCSSSGRSSSSRIRSADTTTTPWTMHNLTSANLDSQTESQAHHHDDPFADPADDDVSIISGPYSVGAFSTRHSARDDLSIVSSLNDYDEVASIHEARIARLSFGTGKPIEDVTNS